MHFTVYRLVLVVIRANAIRWAPITDPDPTACGRPQSYDASKEFAGKKVVLVSVPGENFFNHL